jgi:hypothetical protein
MIAACFVALMVIIFLIGGVLIMVANAPTRKEVRNVARADIAKHKEMQIKLTEAQFEYESALAKLKVIQAQDEELKLSINSQMDSMGFMNRLLVPFSK